MRALVLAAGYGERLYPLTAQRPKPMIDIGGKPILQHNLELLAASGVTDVTINLHHRAEVIPAFFGDGAWLGLSLRYAHEPQLLGTAGAVGANGAWLLDGGDDFAIVYGDNLSTIGIERLTACRRHARAGAALALYHRDDVGSSGIVGFDESGRITRFLEKPSAHEIFSNWVNAGYIVATGAVIDAIPGRRPCDLSRDVFPAMLAAGVPLAAYCMRDEALWWIDSPADYEATKASFASETPYS